MNTSSELHCKCTLECSKIDICRQKGRILVLSHVVDNFLLFTSDSSCQSQEKVGRNQDGCVRLRWAHSAPTSKTELCCTISHLPTIFGLHNNSLVRLVLSCRELRKSVISKLVPYPECTERMYRQKKKRCKCDISGNFVPREESCFLISGQILQKVKLRYDIR